MTEALHYEKNDNIFKENDKSNEIYLIKEGCVQIYQARDGKEIEIARFFAGDIFGEMAFFNENIRTASARALWPSKVFVLSKEVIEETIEKTPIWFKAMIRILIKRLKELTERYNKISAYHPLEHINDYMLFSLKNGKTPTSMTEEFRNMLDKPEYTQLKEILKNVNLSKSPFDGIK